jgi:5'-nucleotidase / UDP-sugar diphosphatase
VPAGDQLTVDDKQSPLLGVTDSSEKWRTELGSVHFRQAASEVVSSIAAGTSGAVAFSLLSASGPYGKALSIPVAMLAGAITKYGTKGGAEAVLLDQKDHNLKASDLTWGAVDGLSGITASLADQSASRAFLQITGRKELGVKTALATSEMAGKQLVEGSAWTAIQHNVMRGFAGGAAGSATWSSFHETHDHWDQITADPITGIGATLKDFATDTVIGTATGGAFGGTLTAFSRSPEIMGRTMAGIKGDAGYLKMNEFVINDLHSNLDRLSQVKTKLDERSLVSAANGVPSEFDVAGDVLSGHVNFAFTRGGEVENQALAKMGLRNIIPGNHEYDAPGQFVPERYPAVMAPILKANPEISLLNANLDLSAYPQYAALTKPYVVHEIIGPNGPEKVATVGLITEEGAVGNIRYEDAAQTAVKTVRELNAQGIKNVKLLTHLGLEEDKKLAQTLLNNDLIVAKISGGHSHDILASPVWVGKQRSLSDRLKFWQANPEIPITQAGSSGNYLSENHIVFNQDGSANRWLTTGKLHSMQDVAHDLDLKQSIDSQTTQIGALKATKYDASATQSYSLENSRNRETPLGNLIADATLSGLQKRMGADAPQIAMVQSGGIRSEISAGQALTRQEISNVFMNAGRVEGERKELVMVTMSGKNIRDAVEYGLREYPLAEKPSMASRFNEMFGKQTDTKFDEPGNFLQVSGMKYAFDLQQKPWSRVKDVSVKMPDGSYQPIQDSSQYKVMTRFHPVDKWNHAGFLGQGLSQDQIYAKLNAKPIEVSQVDLLGEHIQGRTLNPLVDSKVEGRVINTTPLAQALSLRPQTSIVGFSTLAANDATTVNDTEEKRRQ